MSDSKMGGIGDKALPIALSMLRIVLPTGKAAC
jgi:hypothetical protein